MRAQVDEFYKIYGHVVEFNSNKPINNANLTLLTKSARQFETKSDSLGYYEFNNILIVNSECLIQVNQEYYFTSRSKVYFGSAPNDTVIDFFMTLVPHSTDWLPEIYFKYNSLSPIDSSIIALNLMAKLMINNSNIKLTIIGHKDSLETIDLRKERAEYVYNELIKLGIDSSRIMTEESDKPNILKFVINYRNQTTCKVEFTEINEKYILNSPINDQPGLRQRNQCVEFNIR